MIAALDAHDARDVVGIDELDLPGRQVLAARVERDVDPAELIRLLLFVLRCAGLNARRRGEARREDQHYEGEPGAHHDPILTASWAKSSTSPRSTRPSPVRSRAALSCAPCASSRASW